MLFKQMGLSLLDGMKDKVQFQNVVYIMHHTHTHTSHTHTHTHVHMCSAQFVLPTV